MILETVWQDARHGARLIRATPAVSATAIASLALGIGASIAMFILVNAVLLRPLPVASPSELVRLFTGPPERPYGGLSFPDYRDYRDESDVFEGLAAYGEVFASLADEGTPDRVRGLIATGNFFAVLGVEARLGRTFTPEDDRNPGEHPVAVLSHRLWASRYGSDPGVVGREIQVNAHPYVVLGVMPPGFLGPDILESYDIYFPMMMQAQVRPPRAAYSGEMDPDLLERRGAAWLRVVGRLRPGVTLDEAEASVQSLSRHLAETFPDTNRDEAASLFPSSRIDPRAYPFLRGVAILLLSVAALVLLVATANVANLLLSRAVARRREIAVRLALGGSRGRLVRQLLTESFLLAILGGALGLLLASWLVDALARFVPATGPFSFTLDFVVDSRVLWFTTAASAAAAVLVGLAPALQSSRYGLVQALRGASSNVGRKGSLRGFLDGRRTLVLVQIALSIVLLVGAGLFLESFRRSSSIHPGFAAEEILTAPLDIDLLRYTREQGQRFYREVIERVDTLPGVRSATVARVLPLQGGRTTELYHVGRSNDSSTLAPTVSLNIVGLDYFRTLDIALLGGRDFTENDVEGSPPVAIANESFVARYFPGGGALGERIALDDRDSEQREIIGIVKDSKYRSLGEETTPYLYLPVAQRHETGMALLVRTETSPERHAADVRRVLLELDPNLPVSDIRPLASIVASSLFPARMAARLLGAFAALAVVLAAIGLYGVMTFAVSRRTREMGIRIALGARPKELAAIVVAEGLLLVGAGIALGWILALTLTRLVGSFLYGVSPSDPTTFLGVGLLLVLVMLAATYFPARRAGRSDPLAALRYE
jgi:predicted permease